MLQYAKAIGKNTDLLTAQVFTLSKIEVDSYGESKVILFAIISGVGDDVFTTVRQCANIMEEIFWSETSNISDRLGNLSLVLQDRLKEVSSLQIILACIKKDILYIHSNGNHQVFLSRKEQLTELTDGIPQNQVISGHLQVEDRVLLINNPITEIVGQENIYWQPKDIKPLLMTEPDVLEDVFEGFILDNQINEPVCAILVTNTVETEVASTISHKFTEDPQKKKLSFPKLDYARVTSLLKFDNLKASLYFLYKPKLLIFLVVMLLLIGVVGFFVFKNYRQSSLRSEQTVGLYREARTKFEEAKKQKDNQDQKAIESLNRATVLVSQILNIDSGNSDARQLKKEIEESKTSILRIYEISDWPVFLSLDLIKNSFNTKMLSISVGKLLLLDEKQKTLVLLDLATKKPQILGGSMQFGGAKFASLNGEDAFTYSVDRGVTRVDILTNKATQVIKPDSNWGFISYLVAFAQNLYLVDSAKNMIYKYSPVQNGYSDRQDYLQSTDSNLSNTNKMEIDYSVWILRDNSEILRFTGGNQDAFSVGGLEKPLSKIQSIYVSEDGLDNPPAGGDVGYVYVLDPENSRMVVLTKNGQYFSQYLGDKFKSATDLVVDKKSKKIFILAEGKIYQIDLKE